MVLSEEDKKRISDIIDAIARLAALDFSKVICPTAMNDDLDAIAIGLNMLSEELQSSVVEKSKLNEVKLKLERFAYTTAHDLKSPINTIIGLCELTSSSLKEERIDELNRYIYLLRKTAEQMKLLVQGILKNSKVDSSLLEAEKIDLNELIQEIGATEKISNNIDLKVCDELPSVILNRVTIHQVLANLMTNAIKYCDKDICEVEVHAKELKDEFIISISDNGPGIDPKIQEDIFELFHTTGGGHSNGIGLTTVKNLLESLGERIWVESSIGCGATFCFSISKRKCISKTHLFSMN